VFFYNLWSRCKTSELTWYLIGNLTATCAVTALRLVVNVYRIIPVWVLTLIPLYEVT